MVAPFNPDSLQKVISSFHWHPLTPFWDVFLTSRQTRLYIFLLWWGKNVPFSCSNCRLHHKLIMVAGVYHCLCCKSLSIKIRHESGRELRQWANEHTPHEHTPRGVRGRGQIFPSAPGTLITAESGCRKTWRGGHVNKAAWGQDIGTSCVSLFPPY